MSLDRYYNNETVKGTTPTFGEDFSPEVNSTVNRINTPISLYDVDGEYVGGIKVPTALEAHIYADDNLLRSIYNRPITYETSGSNPILKINPELDLRVVNIKQGAYSINYNFLHKFVRNCKILQINGDRTEVRIEKVTNKVNAFSQLRDIVISNSSLNSFTRVGVLPELVMNLKNNELYNVINISFEGPVTGVITETLQYPTDRFGNISTTFVPIDNTVQTPNSWRTFIEVYTPAIGESTTNAGEPTQRARRYRLKESVQNPGFYVWEAGSNTFSSGQGNIPSEVPLTEIFDEDQNGNQVKVGEEIILNTPIDFTDLKLTYNRWDVTATSYDKVVLKLDRPLATEFDLNSRFDLDGRIYNSYIEKIIAFPSIDSEEVYDFSEPNFNMDMSDQAGASATNWQTWNSLLDANPTTSQQLVNYYFSGSLGNVKLNIDYSDFANFVHFSSATERVDNFVYKIQQIENYNNRINLLESVSGSDALTNISQSIVRRDTVIGGFDEFEYYLYYGTTSNNYTHWSSSAYTIEPYPKVSTFPHILYPSTSSQGEQWYGGVYDSASLYDEFNDSRLRNMIPIHLQEDERNIEYVTFIDMIGQHFDIQWTYIKSLTDINRREEHPKDGMADNLLKSVADSFGWYLSNGYSDVSLWKYALGVENDGTLFTTGSLESKSRQQIVHETWRRIVNTLPMLYKTKGTARSIKAILATYGIPQAFLKIREWGGPTVSTRKNVYEHERFVNKLELSPSQYLTAPWDDINSDRPNTIEVIGKMPKAHYHILRLTDGSDNVDYFWDYLADTARIRLAVNGTDIISSSYVPYKTRRDIVFTLTSGSVDIQAAWVDDWGGILANPTASVSTPNSTFNSVWTSVGTLQVPGPTTDANIYNYETASIQEVRYFRDGISSEIVYEHAKNREAYFSDDNTTDLDIDTSFDKLMFRVFPDSQVATTSSYITSKHPNQRITTTDSGLVLSASLTNVTSVQLVGEVDTQFVTVPSMGALNLMNNKIRIESASLNGPLNPDKSNELSEFDYAPIDSNLLGTYFSTTDTVNFDIFNSEGYFEADDWVGDPDKRYNADYPLLKYRAKNYFQKYTSGTAIDLILDMLSRYDMSVFTQIQQLLPARVDWHKGILIEPHIFERNKYRRNRDITFTRHMYDGTISMVNHSLTASRNDYDPAEIDLYDYQPSTYRYYIPTLSSSIQCTAPSSTYITSSTTLNSRIGGLATDYLSYNSTNYLILNRISSTKVEIDTALPAASSQSGTIYYTGSFDFIGQNITASYASASTSYTENSASVENRSDINNNDTTFEYQNFAIITGLTEPNYNGKLVRLKCTLNLVAPNNTDIFSTGTDEIDATVNTIAGEIDLVGGQVILSGGTISAGQAQFEISFLTSSISTTDVATNLVHKFSGANWPADVAQYGNIVFDDGNGDDKTYPILERISDTQIKIDTSSHAPNTSGSAVSADTQYSSSAQQSITFTIGDPTLITCVTSSTYTNLSNGYWQYNPIATTAVNHKRSKVYQVPKYFYSTPMSASLKLPSSASMEWWEGQDDRLSLSLENLFYNGCRISSDSLTTDSLDTPDGGPVVEITKVDPNVIVYSTQTPSDGGTTTETPVGTKPVRITPAEVLVSRKVDLETTARPSVALENDVLKPVPFIPAVNKPKISLGEDKIKKLINKLLKGNRQL